MQTWVQQVWDRPGTRILHVQAVKRGSDATSPRTTLREGGASRRPVCGRLLQGVWGLGYDRIPEREVREKGQLWEQGCGWPASGPHLACPSGPGTREEKVLSTAQVPVTDPSPGAHGVLEPLLPSDFGGPFRVPQP